MYGNDARWRRERGFTLMELMVTVAILAILTAMAAPSFSDFIRTQSVSAAMSQLHLDAAFARSQAIRTQTPVAIESIRNDWSKGWRTFADRNANHRFDTGESLLREFNNVSDRIEINAADGAAAAAPLVAFNARGGLTRGGEFNAVACVKGYRNSQDKQDARNLHVSASGRADVAKGKGNARGVTCR